MRRFLESAALGAAVSATAFMERRRADDAGAGATAARSGGQGSA